jgi:hypothetical protein
MKPSNPIPESQAWKLWPPGHFTGITGLTGFEEYNHLLLLTKIEIIFGGQGKFLWIPDNNGSDWLALSPDSSIVAVWLGDKIYFPARVEHFLVQSSFEKLFKTTLTKMLKPKMLDQSHEGAGFNWLADTFMPRWPTSVLIKWCHQQGYLDATTIMELNSVMVCHIFGKKNRTNLTIRWTLRGRVSFVGKEGNQVTYSSLGSQFALAYTQGMPQH